MKRGRKRAISLKDVEEARRLGFQDGWDRGYARRLEEDQEGQKKLRDSMDRERRQARIEALKACATMADAVAHAIMEVGNP